jgi:hypothetical protein
MIFENMGLQRTSFSTRITGLINSMSHFIECASVHSLLKVREARRMKGLYIMTQKDRTTDNKKSDSIGMGSYNIDTHNAQRFPQGKGVVNEGDVEMHYSNHFQIPYRSLVPLQV